MPTNSKGHAELSQAERQNALGKILGIAAQQSAKLVMYGSCLGAIALIPENSIPATLAGLAAGVGVNSLANLIESVAHSKGTSDADITMALEQAVLESNFEQIIASNHTILSEVRRLTVWQDQIKLFIQTDNDRIIELLINYNTSIVNLKSEFEALGADIKKLQKALSKKSARAAKATVESSSDVLITTEKIEGDQITITGEKSTGASPVSRGKTTIKAKDVAGKTVDITGKTTLD